MVVGRVGKYEIGRIIGEDTYAKVKFAQNTEFGESVAMKILDRNTIIKHKMVDQIPHLRPAEYKRSRLSRNRRTLNRAYGGVLSGSAVRESGYFTTSCLWHMVP